MSTDYFHIQLPQAVEVLVPLENAAEVTTLTRKDICPIPGVAPQLMGVLNHRGRLLWVLDLSAVLGLDAGTARVRAQDKLTLLVMAAGATNPTTGQAEYQLGCVIAALKGIVSLEAHQVSGLVAPVANILPAFVSGGTEVNGASVAILNANAVFTAFQPSLPTTSMVQS